MEIQMYTFLWTTIFLATLIWSGIYPRDQFTWLLEVLPAVVGALILLATYKKFPLTPLLYALILAHCIVLMVGGHYTYAEVPLFDTLKEVLHWERNNYDKVGHFFQGFVPALIAREIFIRKQVISTKTWLNFIVICVVLAISAFYELIEWWVALATKENAEAFLGTQGYVWDTQSDMAYALLGGIIALFSLSSLHDKELKQLR